MRLIGTGDNGFPEFFRGVMERGGGDDETLAETVADIVREVARRGDAALFEYTSKFDGYTLTAASVQVAPEEIRAAAARVSSGDREMLEMAAARVESFHRRQLPVDWMDDGEEGVRLGQRPTPLEKVGIYVPGGRAAYPSTVLMAALPARIAGVEEIVAVTPLREGTIDPLVALAMELGGVSRVFQIGGAQAVAALAYGTASVPRVDKIVGPGNAYVAKAKQLVFGRVDIDMIAGPSEVLVICDGTAPASFVAADLLAQAEHDDMASAVVLTPDEDLARRIVTEVSSQLAVLPRAEIARRSLNDYGAVIVTRNMEEAVQLANRFAPEHLELIVADPEKIIPRLRHAGAIFVGPYTPEVLGDYLAGPNHILPTGGTARFSSPLGVYDFVKRTSILSFTGDAFRRYGHQAARFAVLEGLDAHSRAAAVRLGKAEG